MYRLVTRAAFLSLLAVISLQATVIYNFSGTGQPSEYLSFSLAVPDFINPSVNSGFLSLACAQLDSNSNCDCGLPSAVFFSNTGSNEYSAQLTIDALNDTLYNFHFPTGAFATPGIYAADETGSQNPGTLEVTLSPEPSTILFVVSGSCLCGLFFRYRANTGKNRTSPDVFLRHIPQ
jgi:hypothetical protein